MLICADLAACSAIPPEYNPVEWAQDAKREVQGWFGQTPQEPSPPPIEPPPGEGRPFPNLATVPPPPPRDTVEKRAERQRQLAALMATRDESLAADTGLRSEGKLPEQPLPPVPTEAGVAERQGAPAQPSQLEQSLRRVSPTLGVAASPKRITRGTEAPSPPSALAAAVVPPTPSAAPPSPVLTTSERRGSISFGRDATAPSADSQRVLQQAAAYALAQSGRVRLVPAQYARQPMMPRDAQARSEALRRSVTAAGLPADRLQISDSGNQRVDLYDVYVDY